MHPFGIYCCHVEAITTGDHLVYDHLVYDHLVYLVHLQGDV